jgi:hypothetical protein
MTVRSKGNKEEGRKNIWIGKEDQKHRTEKLIELFNLTSQFRIFIKIYHCFIEA